MPPSELCIHHFSDPLRSYIQVGEAAGMSPQPMQSKALMLTTLMLLSLMAVAGVALAEAPDGTSTTGPDRNPMSPEQDGGVLTREIDVAIKTTETMSFGNRNIVQSYGGATAANVNVGQTIAWTKGYALDTTADDLIAAMTGTPACSAATYTAVALPSNLMGSGGIATIICSGGSPVLTAITVTTGGTGYVIGEVITIPIATLGVLQVTTVVFTLAAGDILAAPTNIHSGHTTAGLKTSQSNLSIGSAEPTVISMAYQGDGNGANDAATLTLQNWYAAIDRSAAHGVGSAVTNAKADLTNGATTNGVQMFDINEAGGIDALLPTVVSINKDADGNSVGYAITNADGSAAALFFGYDVTAAFNMTVYVNGIAQTVGNAYGVQTTDEVQLRCSDASCTNDPIDVGMPGVYNYTNSSETYNASIRIDIYSITTIKITVGLLNATDKTQAATHGLIIDPSIHFGEDSEPGVRIGQIEDGGASWCDAKWFMARCGASLSFDGNATDGMDGLMLKYQLPLEVMYSQSSWGGWDKIQLTITHSLDQCFNGELVAYMVPGSDINTFRSKNSWGTYAISGDYYTVTEPSSGYQAGQTTLGSPSSDYCFGPGTTYPTTKIDVDTLESYTSTHSPMTAFNNGFYDFDTQLFSFYLIIAVKASANINANGDAILDEFQAKTGFLGSTPGDEFALTFSYTGSRDPLLDQAPTIYRSTNNTNDTNPNFGSPYYAFYSGHTPTDSPVAGRNQTAGDSGGAWMGTQTVGNQVRSPNVWVSNATGTVWSTVECGMAAYGGSMKSATIAITTNTNFDAYTGGGQNGSGVPAQSEWIAYGPLVSNNQHWTTGPTTGTGAVDNTKSNSASNAVSFTGVFINGDDYQATCTFEYYSYDIHQARQSIVTVSHIIDFSAAYGGIAVTGGGGGDVDEEDGLFDWDQYSLYDLAIVALIIFLIGVSLFMWNAGSKIETMDERTAMLLFAVGAMGAWIAHHFGGTGSISENAAEIYGTLGFVMFAIGAWMWAHTTKMGDRNSRYFITGLFLLVVGAPSALANFSDSGTYEAMWSFPVWAPISALTVIFSMALMVTSAIAIFTEED
jgi:cbb3-type cytochrome oxidase subunit 3